MNHGNNYKNIISQSATGSQVNSIISSTVEHMQSLEYFIQRNTGHAISPYQKLLISKLTWFERE